MRSLATSLGLLLGYGFLSSVCWAGIIINGKLACHSDLKPGQQIEDTVAIVNQSDAPTMVQVKLVDYHFDSSGRVDYLDKGTLERSNAAWVTLGKTYFEIPAKGSYDFPYTIRVPEDPSLNGSYWSLLLVEPIVENTMSISQEEPGVGVTVITRYGVQLSTHVGDRGNFELKVLGKEIKEKEGKKWLTVAIENIGTELQIPLFTAEFINDQGTLLKKLEAPKQRIYPGCSVLYQAELTEIPQGKYKAMLFFDDVEHALSGAQYDIDL